MGEYDKTYNRLEELKIEKARLIASIQIDGLTEQISYELAEIEVAIGENLGYLIELHTIDGEYKF